MTVSFLGIISAINLLAGVIILFLMMTERMKNLPGFHRLPVGLIACSLIIQAAFQLGGLDRSEYPVWIARDIGFYWLAIIAWSSSWRHDVSSA